MTSHRYLAWPGLALLAGAGLGYAAGRFENAEARARFDEQAREIAELGKAVRSLKASCGQVKLVSVAAAAAATARPEEGSANPGAPEAAVEVEPTPEALEADEHYLQGEALLGEALRAGVWTSQDAERLRALGGALSLEQRSVLLETLAQHLNAGKLRYDGEGSPF